MSELALRMSKEQSRFKFYLNLELWRPQGDSNPRCRRERAMS